MLTVDDFMELDGMFYVGNIVDTDGDGWVTEAEAEEICRIANKCYEEETA